MLIPREMKEAGAAYFSGERPTFATVLLAILFKLFGPEVLDWDGLTIQLEIKDRFGVDVPRRVYDKLMALITALSTDRVYKEVPLFDEFVSAINGEGMGIEQDIPAVDDVAWAVAELSMNDPDPVTRDPKNPWSKDVQKYVRVVLDDEGMSIAPKVLDFAPSKVRQLEGMDAPEVYAGSWGSSQDRADEVDRWVDNMAMTLIRQLMDLGIELQPTEAPAAAG